MLLKKLISKKKPQLKKQAKKGYIAHLVLNL